MNIFAGTNSEVRDHQDWEAKAAKCPEELAKWRAVRKEYRVTLPYPVTSSTVGFPDMSYRLDRVMTKARESVEGWWT